MCTTSAPVRLLGPIEVRTLAEEVGIRPTKAWGQNFVLDPGTVRKIVEIAGISTGDTVIEIGPGLGSLTLALLEAGADLTVVEIDDRLAAKLPGTLAQFAPGRQVEVIPQDAMKITAEQVLYRRDGAAVWEPKFLIANLPYNVSVPVLLHFLTIFPSLERTVVMVQKEVADRLAASAGNKIYGVPSVKANYFGSVTRSRVIGRTVFWPQPHIDSALVIIDRHTQPAWPLDEKFRQSLFTVIDAAFSARRKTLRQALASWAGDAQTAEQILLKAQINPSRRAETLTIDDFIRLAQI